MNRSLFFTLTVFGLCGSNVCVCVWIYLWARAHEAHSFRLNVIIQTNIKQYKVIKWPRCNADCPFNWSVFYLAINFLQIHRNDVVSDHQSQPRSEYGSSKSMIDFLKLNCTGMATTTTMDERKTERANQFQWHASNCFLDFSVILYNQPSNLILCWK